MIPLLRHARYVLSGNPVTGLAFGLFAIFLIAALFGPLLAPYSPLQSNAAMALKSPSASSLPSTAMRTSLRTSPSSSSGLSLSGESGLGRTASRELTAVSSG